MGGTHGHAHHAHGHHDHAHGHHGHHHGPANYGTAFAIGMLFNGGFVVAEGLAGWRTGSVALLADAGHNLSDVLSLGLAWGGHVLAARRPDTRFTYGLGAASILAALANALLLILACGLIVVEAGGRLIAGGAPADGHVVMAVAAVGVAVNLGTALLFVRGQADINIRGAYLHMAADAAVSAGVVVSGLLTVSTGAGWIDPATSLLIVGAILLSGWGLLRDSLRLSLQGVPPQIDIAAVTARLAALPGVTRAHHVHIWPTSTTGVALTAHLIMPAGADDAFLAGAADMLDHEFGIDHATIQVARVETVVAACGERPPHA